MTTRFEVRDMPGPDVCVSAKPVDCAGATVEVACGHPTFRAVYVDRDQFAEGDPRRDHTIFPVCELHEISLFLKGGLDADD